MAEIIQSIPSVPTSAVNSVTKSNASKDIPVQRVIIPPVNNTSTTTTQLQEQQTTVLNRIITVFPKTIELDELSLPGEKNIKTQKVEDVISMEFPLIKINDYIFNREEILNFSIDCTEFLPKISLDCAFISQLFLAKEMPKDGDIISVAIRNKTDTLKIIRNDYVITGVHVLPTSTERKELIRMSFYGELFIPGLKSQKNDYHFEGTTLEAAKDFAKRYKLGFSSNEDDTNDKQIWLKANIAGDIFINNLIERAWRDNKSFYACWIDVYYNLNFINLNKQLMSAESEVDVAALISNFDKNWNYGANTEEEKTRPMVKVFSNYLSFRTTPFYIITWRPINKSSNITFQIGTKMTCEMFEHNKDVYENPKTEKNKNYWAITVEPTYDEDKSNKMILLRGRAKFDASTNTKDLKRANYSYTDIYEKYPWLGVQYTISNPDNDNLQWTGNHHKSYQLAKVQNLINNKELDKLNVHVEVNGNNFNIIRGDKLPMAIIKVDSIENMKINPDAEFNDMLDRFYSGWYIVKGFVLSWSSTSKSDEISFSNFTQEFILTRREWPPPLPVQAVNKTKI